MAHAADEHRRVILDQFTRQSVPFSQMRDHSRELRTMSANEAEGEDSGKSPFAAQ